MFKIESGVHNDYDPTVNANGGFVTHNYVKFADVEYSESEQNK